MPTTLHLSSLFRLYLVARNYQPSRHFLPLPLLSILSAGVIDASHCPESTGLRSVGSS